MQVSFTVWAPMPSEEIDEATHSYKPGDIVECSPFVDNISEHPRFILFNITDMPDNSLHEYQFRRMKRLFTSSHSIDVRQVAQIRRRSWRVNFSLMPPQMQQHVRETRGITIPWVQAKLYLCMRDVIDESDYTQDGNVFLQDGDL